jgi:hypothetical protein
MIHPNASLSSSIRGVTSNSNNFTHHNIWNSAPAASLSIQNSHKDDIASYQQQLQLVAAHLQQQQQQQQRTSSTIVPSPPCNAPTMASVKNVIMEASSRSITSTSNNHNRNTIVGAKTKNSPAELFPYILHGLLEDMEKVGQSTNCSRIVSWAPDGKSFSIHNEELFSAQILPTYFFNTITKKNEEGLFAKFRSQLDDWGFDHIAESGAFFHPCFQKGQASMCRFMRCGRKTEEKEEHHHPKDETVVVGEEMKPLHPTPVLPIQVSVNERIIDVCLSDHSDLYI